MSGAAALPAQRRIISSEYRRSSSADAGAGVNQASTGLPHFIEISWSAHDSVRTSGLPFAHSGVDMTSTVSNNVKAVALTALAVAIRAMGIYVADADDAPGAAVIGLVLMSARSSSV